VSEGPSIAPSRGGDFDVVVVGAGAAGLFAAIHAGRGGARVVALDGAKTLGAKILVAGGGRCNVTHHAVDEKAYAGSSPNAIKNVLRRFGVAETVRFFEAYGVELKREETGKLFPTTDDARTILNALLTAAHDAGVAIRHPQRVTAIERGADGVFTVRGEWGEVRAPRANS
jgi:predicted Rossmann fold flavoprotein